MSALDAPVSPATLPALITVANDPRASTGALAEVVASDAALAARVLSLANSAQFGLSRRVIDIRQGVALVGSAMVQTVAIAGACNLLDGRSGLTHAREHAVRTACAARILAGRAGLSRTDAFAAGLLHDLGELLLWKEAPRAYAEAHATWRGTADQLRGERGMYGTDHALAAREQLAAWRLPGHIVDAVGDHHRPDLGHHDLSTLVAGAEDLVEARAVTARLAVFGIGPDEAETLLVLVDEDVEEIAELLRSA